MVYIFVDTNIYVGAGYVFDNDFFAAIEKYSLSGEVKLLTCSICENEVKAHIKEDVGNFVKEANKKLKKGIFYAIRSDVKYTDRYLTVDEEHAERTLLSKYDDYLKRVGAEFIPIEVISVEELMDDYFHMKPPFEPKKPKEFKDAIMVQALKRYQESIGENIHILSDDDGFRKAFGNDRSFVVYEYHKKFLQYLLRRKEVCYAFEQYCQTDKDEDILNIVSEYIAECEFNDASKLEFKLLDTVEIGDITTEFLYCEIVDEKNVEIHISVEAIVDVNARYLDEENSYYDNKEKEYIYRSYMDVIEQHGISFEMVLNGSYKMTESSGQDILEKYDCLVNLASEKESDSFIELSEGTFIDVIDCEEYVPAEDELWFESNSVYCSECGRRIGFGGSEYYFTYDDEPLCDDCMEDNENGFVCPNCSRKYPEDMRGNSGMFCVDCEQELDV